MVIVILGEEGEEQSPFIRKLNNSHVGRVLAMAPLSTGHEQKTSASLTVPVGNH